MMVFRYLVFFPFAKRGFHCLKTPLSEARLHLSDGEERNHPYSPGLHFLKCFKCVLCFAAIQQ